MGGKKRARARNPWEHALSELVECLGWKKNLGWKEKASRSGTPHHIVVLEAMARARLIRRLARRVRCHHARHLSVGDARASLGAAAKGRSGARALNWVLRKSLPDLLGGDFVLPSFWVESARMPADGVSRGSKVPRAAAPSEREREVLAGQRPLVEEAELARYRHACWVAPRLGPLRWELGS